jgi:hypothetical protein
MRTASWVIVRLSDGHPVLETFNEKAVQCLNVEKYKAVPILEWLQSINKSLKG